MGDIINLRRARKARARQDAQTGAAANRALHGRTKAEKEIEERTRIRREALLDGAAIVKPAIDGGEPGD